MSAKKAKLPLLNVIHIFRVYIYHLPDQNIFMKGYQINYHLYFGNETSTIQLFEYLFKLHVNVMILLLNVKILDLFGFLARKSF